MTADQKPRVLIVEDELLLLMDLEYTLLDLGYQIAGKASNLSRGQALARELDIDLAVLDVNLSGLNSAAIADELIARGVPFVFASGYTESSIPERFRTCPRIAKPYETVTLQRVLQQLLGAKAPIECAKRERMNDGEDGTAEEASDPRGDGTSEASEASEADGAGSACRTP